MFDEEILKIKNKNQNRILKKKKFFKWKNFTLNRKCKRKDWLVGFYGMSTFVGYLTPIPFLYK